MRAYFVQRGSKYFEIFGPGGTIISEIFGPGGTIYWGQNEDKIRPGHGVVHLPSRHKIHHCTGADPEIFFYFRHSIIFFSSNQSGKIFELYTPFAGTIPPLFNFLNNFFIFLKKLQDIIFSNYKKKT